MLVYTAALAALIPVAFAFSDTHPVVAWSSHKSNALDSLAASSSGSWLASILSYDEICDHDAVVIIDQPGLHASDLRTLHSSSHLARALESAPSSFQLAYARGASPSSNEIAETLFKRCGSRITTLIPGVGGNSVEGGSKHVICMDMPHLSGVVSHRKQNMVDHDSLLYNELESVATLFTKYLVILTGSPSHLSARQAPASDLLGSTFVAPNSTTGTDGGILKRYQILTPALITTLLVTFFILVPVVMMGVAALSSIQSPLSTNIPKGFDSQEKKNQ